MFYKVVLFILLISTFSFGADKNSKIVGHQQPLKSEVINPIVLDCGFIIEEFWGEKITKGFIQRLNDTCLLAHSNFGPFLRRNGLKKAHDIEFYWSGSFIPDGTCYRCLNDIEYRFANRPNKEMLSGYSNLDDLHSFIGVNRDDVIVTFLHELYHAMSEYYGVFDTLGNTFEERVVRDESLARQFTIWLIGRV